MRQLLANSPAWWDRIVAPCCWSVAGVGDLASASFTSISSALARWSDSEFSRPRHCADLQHPGEPPTLLAGYLLPILPAGGGGPAALAGRRCRLSRSPRLLIGQYGPYFHLQTAEAGWAGGSPGSLDCCWSGAGSDTGPCSGNACFRCCCCCSELRPWRVAIALVEPLQCG